MGRVIVVGSINVDLVHALDDFPKPGETVKAWRVSTVAGGKGANQAVAAAGAGAEVVMVGCVGDDALGGAYVERLRGLGVDAGAIRAVAGESTGLANILLDGSGENLIILVPGANHHVSLDDATQVTGVGPGDVVLLQLEIEIPQVERIATWAAERGARVIINIAPYAALDPAVLALADPIVANEHEALLLADSGAGVGSLLVTLGPNGAVWDGVSVPAAPVPGGAVVDTTGAGDAFVGALAAALAAGADRADALAAAAAAGAAAVATPGAQPDADLRPPRQY